MTPKNNSLAVLFVTHGKFAERICFINITLERKTAPVAEAFSSVRYVLFGTCTAVRSQYDSSALDCPSVGRQCFCALLRVRIRRCPETFATCEGAACSEPYILK